MCRIRSPLLRLLLAWLPAAPARALEEIVIQIPLLERSFTGKVSELANPETLQNGKSDLAQLDRASGGGGAWPGNSSRWSTSPFPLASSTSPMAQWGRPCWSRPCSCCRRWARWRAMPPT